MSEVTTFWVFNFLGSLCLITGFLINHEPIMSNGLVNDIFALSVIVLGILFFIIYDSSFKKRLGE